MTDVVASRRARWIPSTRAPASCPAGSDRKPWSTIGSAPGSRESIRTLPRDAGFITWT